MVIIPVLPALVPPDAEVCFHLKAARATMGKRKVKKKKNDAGIPSEVSSFIQYNQT